MLLTQSFPFVVSNLDSFGERAFTVDKMTMKEHSLVKLVHTRFYYKCLSKFPHSCNLFPVTC
jgi:hypothetical protein